VYQLDTLYRRVPENLPITESQWQAGPSSVMDFGDAKQAEISDVLFVSVPSTTSAHTCEKLRDMILISLSDKKQVMILTHNIELLRAEKLKPADAAKVIKNIEEMQSADEEPRIILPN